MYPIIKVCFTTDDLSFVLGQMRATHKWVSSCKH